MSPHRLACTQQMLHKLPGTALPSQHPRVTQNRGQSASGLVGGVTLGSRGPPPQGSVSTCTANKELGRLSHHMSSRAENVHPGDPGSGMAGHVYSEALTTFTLQAHTAALARGSLTTAWSWASQS